MDESDLMRVKRAIEEAAARGEWASPVLRLAPEVFDGAAAEAARLACAPLPSTDLAEVHFFGVFCKKDPTLPPGALRWESER